jgi:hypothetical protein
LEKELDFWRDITVVVKCANEDYRDYGEEEEAIALKSNWEKKYGHSKGKGDGNATGERG